MLTRDSLRARFHVDRPGALLSSRALEVNPLALTYALLARAVHLGAHMLRPQRLSLNCLGGTKRPFAVRAKTCPRLHAQHVIVATGYEALEQFPALIPLTELRTSFAIATTPLRESPWPQRALFWETGDPYFYARTTADGRVLAGGEDEPHMAPRARNAILDAKARTLSRKLRTLFPHVRNRVAFRWGGTFARTADGLPFIGQHERWPHVHFALGYGGNGIPFALLAARLIAADIAGRPQAAAKLFAFDR
jgi:glycine/D-amino acid oxidase-like deaminating enzyme